MRSRGIAKLLKALAGFGLFSGFLYLLISYSADQSSIRFYRFILQSPLYYFCFLSLITSNLAMTFMRQTVGTAEISPRVFAPREERQVVRVYQSGRESSVVIYLYRLKYLMPIMLLLLGGSMWTRY